jgi:hypothetical protein
VGSDRNDRDAGSMRVVEPVDEVQVARTTARRANCHLASDGSFTGRSKRGSLFVADVLPRNRSVMEERVREPIERVTRYAVDTPDARSFQGLDYQV